METLDKLIVEWGVASQMLAGEVESGDKHVVKIFPHGALLAAVDGLGHGEEAAAAANMAGRLCTISIKKTSKSSINSCAQTRCLTPGVWWRLSIVNSLGGTMTLTWIGGVG